MNGNFLLGLLLREELRVHKELSDLGSLISLELDDLSRLVVLDDGTVAGEFLDGQKGAKELRVSFWVHDARV